MIDGVAVGAPRCDENKPLRDRQAVTNTVSGAIDIQEAFELHEWGQQAGQSPIVWAPYLRTASDGRPAEGGVLLQFMTGWGPTVITPSPEGPFEVPAQGLLPENLNYIR